MSIEVLELVFCTIVRPVVVSPGRRDDFLGAEKQISEISDHAQCNKSRRGKRPCIVVERGQYNALNLVLMPAAECPRNGAANSSDIQWWFTPLEQD